jgi:two-component system OmpR family sensor kinase/two-component system sensor histidine kinase BaeS
VLAFVSIAWVVAALFGAVGLPGWAPAFGLLVALGLFVLAIQLLRRVHRMGQPLDELVIAAERVERGDYSARVEERGPPQTRSLARAFNQMSARLAAVDTERRTFLAEMAHEMRTPLTVLQGQLEAVADGVYPADAEHIAPLLDQTMALERLVDDLRTVALADAGALALARTPTDLGALIEEQLDAFRASAPELTLETEIGPNLPLVDVDAGRVAQVIRNLLSNAIRHTSSGGHVVIAARSARPNVVVEVRDNGSGIAADLLPRVFDRFAKGSGPSGSGLGLAIAHDLVAAHGGTISAESSVDQGTTIRFTLPT